MKYLTKFILFEGKYQEVESQISKLKNIYQQEVTDCLSDLIDNYHGKPFTPVNNEDDLSIHYELRVDYNKINDFFIDFTDCYERCQDYIGKTIELRAMRFISNSNNILLSYMSDTYLNSLNKILDIDAKIENLKQNIHKESNARIHINIKI